MKIALLQLNNTPSNTNLPWHSLLSILGLLRETRIFCIGDEPKSGLARDLGDCLQSRNVPFGTSGDL